MKKTLLAATLAAAVLQAPAALARDTISVVGSSTVYPFTTVVAERFGKTTSFRTPKLGLPPTSGTRDAFVELAMKGGCTSFAWIKALKDSDEDRYAAICHGMREDGAFIEAGGNDNLIVQKLKANKSAFGVFGYSFLEENEDSVQGAVIDGKAPSFETIADGSYEISRPLYIYAKKAHIGVVPGLEEFLAEFVSKKAMGEEGYLSDRGLIPLQSDEYQRVVSATIEKSSMSL